MKLIKAIIRPNKVDDIKDALDSLETAVNALLARGLLRLLTIASGLYESLLEEHALQRARLVGMLLHGTAWRERPSRGAVRRLLIGLILAAVACAAIAAGSFVAAHLNGGRLGP